MGIRFACHSCKHALHVKDFLGGKRGKCPDCGISFQIPSSDAPTSIPVAALDAPESPESASPREPAPFAEQAPSLEATSEEVAWYLRIEDGSQFGPVDETTFQTWVSEGRVTQSSHVWRDGWPEWQPAPKAFPAQFTPPEPVPVAAPPVSSPPVAAAAVPPPAVAPAQPAPVSMAAAAPVVTSPETPAAPVPANEQAVSAAAATSLTATETTKQEAVPGLSPIQRARIDRRLKKKRNYQLMLVGLCVVAVILVVALILVIIMQSNDSPG